MPRTKRTWTEKLADARAKPGLPKKWYCDKAKQTLVIGHPDEIEHIIRRAKRGKVITMAQIGELLRQKHKADMACPMTTGIFSWLLAHAACEQEQAGRKRVMPWWRAVKTDGELNPKYPGGGKLQAERLKAEGHRIITKGRTKKKLVVADLDRAKVGHMHPEPKRRTPSPDGLKRKVLRRDDFGLCLLLPKTLWSQLPPEGKAKVTIDGAKRPVTVQTEPCNCRGNGWHEHRFLSLPKSANAQVGQVVVLATT